MLHLQEAGVGEYRHFIPARALAKLGADVTYWQPPDKVPSDMAQWVLENGKRYDVLHVGYASAISAVNLLAAAREYTNWRMLTDIDDDIEHVPPYNFAAREYLNGAEQRNCARLHLRISDGVTATTPPLSTVLDKFARNVRILPNCLDEASWHGLPIAPDRDDDKSVRILFSNSLGHYGDMAEVREVMDWLVGKYDGKEGRAHIKLLFAGMLPDWAIRWMQDMKCANVNRAFLLQSCNVPTYRAMLKWLRPDILCAPLARNEFNNSKSHIKAYDAAMCGAALVCTDVGAYEPVPSNCAVKLDNSFAQWQYYLEQLIEDVDHRRTLHSNLTQYALDNWTISQHIDKWVAAYEHVLAAPPVRELADIKRPA